MYIIYIYIYIYTPTKFSSKSIAAVGDSTEAWRLGSGFGLQLAVDGANPER